MVDKEPVPLQMKQLPIFVTLGVAVESNLIIVDLNRPEEETLDSKLVVGMTPGGELCCMYPLGSNLWTNEHFLDRSIALVQSKVVALKHLIAEAVRAQADSPDTIVINSTAFLQHHPLFADDAPPDVPEAEKLVHDAPEGNWLPLTTVARD